MAQTSCPQEMTGYLGPCPGAQEWKEGSSQ